MEYQQIIIVEGKADTQNLRKVFGREIQTIETGGSSVDPKVLKRLSALTDNPNVIILTDPDIQGERIRKIVADILPKAKHAFITKEEGHKKGAHSLGVEFASPETLKTALANLLTPQEVDSKQEKITLQDLRLLGLIDRVNSARMREQVASKLRLGQVNGKQLLKRLNQFQIKLSQIKEALHDK